jgi:hypothetical protein
MESTPLLNLRPWRRPRTTLARGAGSEGRSSAPRRLSSDERGAVMVESIITIPMLLAFFAMILQYAYLSMASLVVQHAAVVAARSASVIVPDDPAAFSADPSSSPVGSTEGARLDVVTDSVNKLTPALQPLPLQGPVNSTMEVELKRIPKEGAADPSAAEVGAEDLIQVTVKYDFDCGVIFGGATICGTDHKMTLTSTVVTPNQGANYGYF